MEAFNVNDCILSRCEYLSHIYLHIDDDDMMYCIVFVDEEEEQHDSSLEVQEGFQDGELVWGPHGNFPSWPGKLIRSDCSTKVLVCWFGNKDTTQVDTETLKSLSDGLEAHHRERKKLRK